MNPADWRKLGSSADAYSGMNSKRRVLTGITTTGTPHLGNYVGAIRPAIAASRNAGVESFYFLADYHALVKCDDPARVQRSTLEIAASWLACGLDPEKVYFYRQSDIPEIPELTWLLTCVTAKGLLNRAHAYKAANDANAARGEDADAGSGDRRQRRHAARPRRAQDVEKLQQHDPALAAAKRIAQGDPRHRDQLA